VGAAVEPHPAVRAADVLWRFSRPHTVIGTALSVVGLWLIADAEAGRPVLNNLSPDRPPLSAADLLATLVAALAVNVSIVGINQITDVDIDRINKPFLPIAAGDLTLNQAKAIVAAATVIPLGMALTQGAAETVAVAAALAVGALYSLPPTRLKRFPVAASLCISGVRSLAVNLGVYAHFAGRIDPPVIALCAFVLPFSFAIAVLKDVPDIEGDRRFSIRTFSVRLGPGRVKAIGLAALTLAYVGMAIPGAIALEDHAQPAVMAGGHLAALAILCVWARAADPRDHAAFTRFYMRVWALFFLEYVLVPVACLSA
jgi:homogentisate phytyltransferase / homogentisate geranylgeranyltransferase